MKKIQLLFYVSFALAVSACGGNRSSKGLTGEITVDGSSTVYPITEAVAEEFRAVGPDVRVTVGVSGTGGGFKKFGRGETDISNASRPITASEVALCEENGVEFIELPVAYDGLAVVVNPANDFVDYLTVEELKKIWEPAAQGNINRWSQVREGWPDEPINLYGAGVASGTYDYFTEAIVGKAKSSRGDYTASEDDNVLVQGVANDKNGLGYFGLAYYQENAGKLKLVPIEDGNDENGAGPIAPSLETVSNGTYQPLARPEFIYINAESAQREEMKAFVNFYLENAPQLVEEVDYVPLETEAYELAAQKFERGVTGTIFGQGTSIVGVSMIDLLKQQVSADTVSGEKDSISVQ
ncbi:phosphate ABC transporter substrate-binding protein (PhoT family) [Anseongella ginsenosidimutans]|uniref:Phosphate-binding protein n=1 Tax=Anseongella ginsenosidimutans TaxID=496056 RepID=A0A4R3KPU8_9SPHI|nr:PstS family phosphate ABC transporter substrate-binding protein [Anseongella ginsenosidimutans]QEC52224.1 PstS family phosphate ABC transporter substrate-binding protein [Anseongella ginsenosidimutans]TCS86774.1 phosphate ABC transporter substrate-binding protein (PhoT family) [Anseongella ginsenosidimutans]